VIVLIFCLSLAAALVAALSLSALLTAQVKPIAPEFERMKAFDRDLWSQTSGMPVAAGLRQWNERYPTLMHDLFPRWF